MIQRTLGEIATMIPGAVCPAEHAGTRIRGVGTDTRRLAAGSLFVPLQGEQYDGHRFAAEALARGAAATLWQRDRGAPPAGAHVLVDDTLAALQDLAASYRRQLAVRVVGITGSNGKTTTKEIVSAVLSARWRVHKTKGNLNNHIGLPLTLLELDEGAEIAVLEMGMSGFGEIELLSAIARPDAAIITNIGDAHMQQLGSREGIARAKFEIASGLGAGGLLVYPGDEPLLAALVDEAKADGRLDLLTFGQGAACQYAPEAVRVGADGTAFAVRREDGAVTEPFFMPLLGRHNAVNAVAAYALASRFGVTDRQFAEAIRAMTPAGMRIETVRAASGLTILSDAYNANPAAMKAAIELLRELRGFARKIVVLGDMLELGPDAEAFHREIGRQLAPPEFDFVYTYGELAAYIAEECAARFPPGQVEAFADKAALADRLRRLAGPEDVVLVKGSRGMRMEEVVEALRVAPLEKNGK